MKNKGRCKNFKCVLCGRYISYKDIGNGKVIQEYVWNDIASCRNIIFTHVKCYKRKFKDGN